MVATDGGTGLMASDGANNVAEEQKSGFASALGNVVVQFDLLLQ